MRVSEGKMSKSNGYYKKLVFASIYGGFDCIGINTCWIVSKIIHMCEGI
jgi:hypothetical protein